VVDARADELFGVFEDPVEAVQMAVAAQRALTAWRRADGIEVRVRIGIHSGYPTRSEANYVGMAVHLAARVCSAAHGGQILVTGDTRTALTGCTVDGVRLRSLGDHRLRGIPQLIPLYQVGAKGLATSFPPLRTIRGAG
jgi:class 3 adenylate cyclase